MSNTGDVISRARIAETEKLIRPFIRRTPLLAIDGSDVGLPPAPVLLKLELFQHSGSFKARGAFANLLLRKTNGAGVVAASGGNHRRGSRLRRPAPLGSPRQSSFPASAAPRKIQRIRAYGAEVVVGGDLYADALAASEERIAVSGALSIHAYDQVETLLGQGTLGLELEEQLRLQGQGIDTLLVAVGGGGLIGGIAASLGGRIKIVAVEPEEAPTLYSALAAGHPVDDARAGGVAADSLAPKRVGKLMFPIAANYVSPGVVLVSDDEITSAQTAMWDRLRIVTEPGAAAAFAALLSGKYRPEQDERVAVIVCGANTTAVDFGS